AKRPPPFCVRAGRRARQGPPVGSGRDCRAAPARCWSGQGRAKGSVRASLIKTVTYGIARAAPCARADWYAPCFPRRRREADMDRVEVSMAEAKGETKAAAAPPQAVAPAETPAPAPRRALAAVTALLLGLSVGGGVGIVAGGTLLAAWRSGELESKAQTHGGGEQVVYVESTPAVVHTIDALVVNPAD